MLARILFWWTTINHNIVVSYGFERCQNPQWQSNAPPSDPVWLVQCPPHWPIKGAQGFTQGHWMPPLGEYLLCIAPADDRLTCREKRWKNDHTCWPFRLRWRCAGYDTALIARWRGPGLWQKPLADTTGRVLQLIVVFGHTLSQFFWFFSLSARLKGDWGDVKTPYNNRGMTGQSNGMEEFLPPIFKKF